MNIVKIIVIILLFVIGNNQSKKEEFFKMQKVEEKPMIPVVKWKMADPFMADPFAVTSSRSGEVYVDEKTVYILRKWQPLKGKKEVKKVVRQLYALTKESGALKWKMRAEDDVWPTMISTGDFVYLQVGDTLYALSRDWKFEALQSLRTQDMKSAASCQVADGSVYFRSSSGILYALAGDTGQLRWRFDPVPSWKGLFRSVLRSFGIKEARLPNLPAPVISDGVIVIITQYDIRGRTSLLTALNAETGEVLWTSETPVIAKEPPIVASGTIYVPTSDSVVALTADTGKLKWQSDRFETCEHLFTEKVGHFSKNTVPALLSPSLLSRFRELYPELSSSEPRAKIAGLKPYGVEPPALLAFEGNLLYLLKTSLGSVYWRAEPEHSGLGGTYVVYDRDLLALSAATGKVRWEKHIDKSTGHLPKPTVIATEDVFLYQMGESLHALSAETGETRWKFGKGSIRKPIVRNNMVYLASEEHLYALELGTGKIKWQWQSPNLRLVRRGSSTYPTLNAGRLNIGDYAVAADGTAYVSTREFVFALEPKIPHGSISGVVTDSRSKMPVGDAKVELTKDGFSPGIPVKTDKDGKYTIESVAVGVFDLRVSKDGYQSKDISGIHVEEGQVTSNVNIAIRPVQVGEEVPFFTLKALSGKQVSLSDFKGKVVLLNFWAPG